MKKILLITNLLIGVACNAQDWKFEKKYDEPITNSKSICTYDSGIIFITSLNNDLNHLLIIQKLNVNGEQIWEKTLNFNSKYISAIDITESTNNCYYICGISMEYDQIYGDPFLIKLDCCLELEWMKVFNIPVLSNYFDRMELNNGYIYINLRYLKKNSNTILKINSKGDVIKCKTLENIIDGNFKIRKDLTIDFVGYGYAKFNDTFSFLKSQKFHLDSNLNILDKYIFYENDTNLYIAATNFEPLKYTNNDLLILASDKYPNSLNISIDGSVVLLKNSGVLTKRKIISDTNYRNEGNKIIQLNNNKYIIASDFYPQTSSSNNYFGLIYLVDSNLSVLNTKFENQDCDFSQINGLINFIDNSILTNGVYLKNDFYYTYIQKYDSLLSNVKSNQVIKLYDYKCQHLNLDTLFITNPTKVNVINDSIFISKNKNIYFKNINIHPNPFLESVNIIFDSSFSNNFKIQILNSEGQLILEKVKETYNDCFSIKLDHLKTGVYIINIFDNNNHLIINEKLIKQ